MNHKSNEIKLLFLSYLSFFYLISWNDCRYYTFIVYGSFWNLSVFCFFLNEGQILMCLLSGITTDFDILSYITPWQNHSTPLLCRVPVLFWQSGGTWLRTWSLDTWCVLWSPQSQHGLSDSCAGALGWCIDLALSVPWWVCRPFPVQPEALEDFCPSAVSATPFSLSNKRLLAALQGNNYCTTSDSDRWRPIESLFLLLHLKFWFDWVPPHLAALIMSEQYVCDEGRGSVQFRRGERASD